MSGWFARRRRRLTVGRLAVYLEPRDLWVGVFVGPEALYVCLVPVLVVRWDRRGVRLGGRRLPPVAARGCDECAAEPGELHDRTCRRVPDTWWRPRYVAGGVVR